MDNVDRATYLFKYDAADVAGNNAEQVAFALIVDDPTPPVILPYNKLVTDQIFHPEAHKLPGYNQMPASAYKAELDWGHDTDKFNAYVELPCWKFTDETCDLNAGPCTMKVEASRHPTWGLMRCVGPDGLMALDAVDGDVSDTISFSVKQGDEFETHNGKTLERVSAHDMSEYFGEWENTGDYILLIHATDKAGVYGENSQSNERIATINIEIRDTLPPQITVHGLDNPTIECEVPYTVCTTEEMEQEWHTASNAQQYRCDRGAGAFDELDGPLPIRIQPDPATWAQTLVGSDIVQGPTEFVVTYESEDSSNLVGSAKRTVTIHDTVAPAATLIGDTEIDSHQIVGTETDCRKVYKEATESYHSVCAHSAGEHSFYDPGIEVADSCDHVLTGRTDLGGRSGIYATAECPTEDSECWGGLPFNDRVVGEYIRTYNVKDASNNAATVERTFHNVDMTAPTLDLIGEDHETYEASREVTYTDRGARCVDYVEGDISRNVEISGQIVNMKVPGTYKLQYDCEDSMGNMAVTKKRDIVIEDRSCPVITLNGNPEVFVQAGFPYADEGATATDNLDGDITGRIRTVGNTVDTAEAFYYSKSCKEIKHIAANPPREASGEKTDISTVEVQDGPYYITTTTTVDSTPKSEAVVVTCNFQTETTFFPLTRKNSEGSDEASRYPTCEQYGFVPFTDANINPEDADFVANNFAGFDYTVPDGLHSDQRLCTKAASESFSEDSVLQSHHMPQLRAESGKYVIKYYVTDLFGVANCAENQVERIVVVEDTLKPVMTLKYHGKVINNVDDPTTSFGLMAEAASTNGWLMAAAASGIAGVALFSLSQRKKTPVLVPV